MNVETLKIILGEQKGELQKEIYNRAELGEIEIRPSLIKIITGPRRAGKSFFMLSLANRFFKDKICYVNFDDFRLTRFDGDDFNNLIIAGKSIYGDFNTIFLDELQNVKGWEMFVNTLSKNYNVFVTGSNSKLLSKELGTYITGRHKDLVILPFKFKDVINIKYGRLDVYRVSDIAKIIKVFDYYLENGSYPDIVLDKGLDLNTLFKDVILKDIIYRYKIKDTSVVEGVASDLLYKYAKYFTYNKEAELFKVSTHSVVKYISYLADAYLFIVLPKYSYSRKSQNSSPKKIYPIDVGFIKHVIKTDYDKGRALETLVAINLFRGNQELFYWKDYSGRECDFVIAKNRKPIQLIQVSWVLTEENKDREMDGLVSAMSEFKLKTGLILTYNDENDIRLEGKKIIVKPVWKWLLECGLQNKGIS